MSDRRLLDLGMDDVHQDGAAGAKPKTKTMAAITTKKRNSLPDSSFADPEGRGYPIHDKAHADNAAARLEQQKGSMSPAKYRSIKARIRAAQKRFGEAPKAKGMRMRGGYGFRLSIDHPKQGRIEVRHMSAEPVRCPAAELALLADKDDSAPKWNQLATPGRFFKDGSFFEMTDQTFRDIVRNFNASHNRQVPVDFEHASEMRGSDGTIPMLGAPAQGWIKAVELRGDGNLYGLIEWNDLGRQYVHAKQYKYLSPAVRFGCKDARTGEPIGARLTSAALTNTPFLDGMQPVAAKDQPMPNVTETESAAVQLKGAMCYSSAEYMPQLRACMGLSPVATGKMCKDHVGMLREHLKAAGGDPGATPMGVRLADHLVPLRDMVRPPFGASFEDVLDIVDDMIDAAMDEHEIEYHGGLHPDADEEDMTDAPAADDAALTDTTPEQEPATMADKNTPVTATAAAAAPAAPGGNDALAVMLKDEQTQRMALSAENKELAAKLDAATKAVEAAQAEVVKMKDEMAKAAEQSLSDEVDAVILAYKDTKGVKPEDKGELTAFLKAAPKLFRTQYPPVNPAQAHLLRDLTTSPTTARAAELPADVEVPDMRALTDKFVKEGKSLEDAVSLAYTTISSRTATHH